MKKRYVLFIFIIGIFSLGWTFLTQNKELILFIFVSLGFFIVTSKITTSLARKKNAQFRE